ncbi:hypothetical protein ADUPG1_013001 [Aduncisulcus paluster]|uniref:Uncharacterized protein n=1 Tax=Aduncisulcus paluster TaxID=2918883 RepID=A0ABQ5K526_9EUKA|nr:hypothetical protein ADUPG1_013001 [Aduncisulcus paluster]
MPGKLSLHNILNGWTFPSFSNLWKKRFDGLWGSLACSDRGNLVCLDDSVRLVSMFEPNAVLRVTLSKNDPSEIISSTASHNKAIQFPDDVLGDGFFASNLSSVRVEDLKKEYYKAFHESHLGNLDKLTDRGGIISYIIPLKVSVESFFDAFVVLKEREKRFNKHKNAFPIGGNGGGGTIGDSFNVLGRNIVVNISNLELQGSSFENQEKPRPQDQLEGWRWNYQKITQGDSISPISMSSAQLQAA